MHDVHIYAIVRVKVSDVEANSHREAIEKAEERADLDQLFRPLGNTVGPGVAYVEYADDIDSYLVDEVKDDNLLASFAYMRDKETCESLG